jgi:hypothetical protein
MTVDDKGKSPLEVGIEIDSDGRVVFTDLPPELVDVVKELNPDAIIACDLPEKEEVEEDSGSTESE